MMNVDVQQGFINDDTKHVIQLAEELQHGIRPSYSPKPSPPAPVPCTTTPPSPSCSGISANTRWYSRNYATS